MAIGLQIALLSTYNVHNLFFCNFKAYSECFFPLPRNFWFLNEVLPVKFMFFPHGDPEIALFTVIGDKVWKNLCSTFKPVTNLLNSPQSGNIQIIV